MPSKAWLAVACLLIGVLAGMNLHPWRDDAVSAEQWLTRGEAFASQGDVTAARECYAAAIFVATEHKDDALIAQVFAEERQLP